VTIGVYTITNTDNGVNTTYVGGTQVSFKKRWPEHRNMLKAGIHRNPHLQAAWNKYGENAFEFKIVEEVKNPVDVLAHEQTWLDFYRMHVPVYNLVLCVTQPPMFGKVFTAKHRQRISHAHMGVPLSEEHRQKLIEAHVGFRGKHHSEESKRKLSLALLGRVISEETRRKIGDAHRGKKATEETRRKMSETRKGRKQSRERVLLRAEACAKLYPRLRNRDTGKVIPAGKNLARLCREQGIKNSDGLWAVIHGRRNYHLGWEVAP